MSEHLFIGAIEDRLVSIAPADGALQIVRDNRSWDTAEVVKCPNVRANPVLQLLSQGRFCTGVIGGSEYGDEDLCSAGLTCFGIDNW